MDRLLLGFVLFSIIATSVAYAYADNATQRTITIPHIVAEEKCETFWDGVTPLTQCYFEGINPFKPDVVWDEERKDYIPREQMEEEAKAIYEAEQEEKTPDLPKRYQDRLDELREIENPSRTESRLITLLEHLNAVCHNDVLQFQTWREFDVSTEQYRDPVTGEWKSQLMTKKSMTAVNLDDFPILKKIRLAIQECIGQGQLKSKIISEATTNKIVDNEMGYHFKHQDIAMGKAIYPQEKLADDAKITQHYKAKQLAICMYHLYTDQFKKQAGCELSIEYEHDPSKQKPMPNYVDNSVMKQFLKYKNGNESEILQELKSKNINKYLARLK